MTTPTSTSDFAFQRGIHDQELFFVPEFARLSNIAALLGALAIKSYALNLIPTELVRGAADERASTYRSTKSRLNEDIHADHDDNPSEDPGQQPLAVRQTTARHDAQHASRCAAKQEETGNSPVNQS